MKGIHYLVFSGGGAAVYGHAGAILELSKQSDFSLSQIKAVSGASVGTIAALLISLNFSIDRIVEIIKTFDISKIADGGMLPARVHRLFSEYGVHKGDELYKFILQILEEKTGRSNPETITFNDLKNLGYKDLYVVATKVYKENGNIMAKEKVFSVDKTPDTAVATAILASCSAPGFFRRVRLKKMAKGKYVLDDKGDLYEDGGVVNNYPIDMFDQPRFIPQDELKNMKQIINPHTLGFALLNHTNINDINHPVTKTVMPDNRPVTYGGSLLNALTLQFQRNRLDKKHNRLRTVQIDRLKVGLGDFGITEQDKLGLIKSGKKAVTEYFAFGKYKNRTPYNDTMFANKNSVVKISNDQDGAMDASNDEEFKRSLLFNGI